MLSWFALLVNLVLALSSFYVVRRLVPAHWPRVGRVVLTVLIVVFAFALPAQFLLRRYWLGLGAHSAMQLLQYGMGLFTLLLFFAFARDVLLGAGRLLAWVVRSVRVGAWRRHPSSRVQRERRAFLSRSTQWMAWGASLAVFGVGARRADVATPTRVLVDIPIKNLPDALVGVTIAQLSDIHIGQIRHEKRLLADLAAMLAEHQPDVLVITGDATDGTVANLRERMSEFAQMRGRYGQFFVTGNHEYYSDLAENWIAYWQSIGFRALENAHEVLTINGAPLTIAGVYDLKAALRHDSHRCSPAAALAGAPDAPTILLAHHPDTARLCDGVGRVDVQLSGHTHAGQYFPGTWLVGYVHRFAQGLNQFTGKVNSFWVYVNSGTGYWGAALRHTEVTSEVSWLRLVKAES